DEDVCSVEYWVRHVREAVRFADGVRAMHAAGVTTLLEIGPHGVLCGLGQEGLDADGVAFVAALREGRPDDVSFAAALGALHVRGVRIDWGASFAPFGARRVALPTYAFQRARFWLDAKDDAAPAPEESRFWEAIERGDVGALGDALGIDDAE